MTPPPPPPQLPSRPPAPPPTPGSAHQLHPHQHGGPLVIPLRPEADKPPAPAHNVHSHAHDHDHDLHIHGLDHDLHIHDHGYDHGYDHTTRLEPVRTGGSGIVIRPGPGPVEVFVGPDGELVAAKDDLGVAGSSRPLPRPPPQPHRPPHTNLLTIWPGNRYNVSRPQPGSRPPVHLPGRPRPGDHVPQQPPLQHGFHEVHLMPTHEERPPGPVNGQPERPPPGFHDQPPRQRPPPAYDNEHNIIVGHVPFLNEVHSPVPAEDLQPLLISVGGAEAPTNKVDDPSEVVHQHHHQHAVADTSRPDVGVGVIVSPGSHHPHAGVHFPGPGDFSLADADRPLDPDSGKPDSDGAASGTDGSPDLPTHESDDDLDEPEGTLHGGTQTERPLVVLPPDNKFSYHLDHQGGSGTQGASNKEETPSRNEIPEIIVDPERPPGGSGWHTIESDNEHVYITQNLPTKDDTIGFQNGVPNRRPSHTAAGHRPPSWLSGGSTHPEAGSISEKEHPSGDDLDIHYGRPQFSVDSRPQWPNEGLRPPGETPIIGNRQPPVLDAAGGFGQEVPPFKTIGEDVSAVVDSVLRPPSLNLPPATAVRPTQTPPPPRPPHVTVLTDHQHNNKPHRQPGAPIIVLGRPAEYPGDVATHRPTEKPLTVVDEVRPDLAAKDDSAQHLPVDMLEVDKPPPAPSGGFDLEAQASTARPFKLRPPDDAVLGMSPPPPRVTVVGAGGRQPDPEGDSTHRPVLIGGGRKPPLLPPRPSEFERPPPPAPTTPRRPPFVVTPPTPAYSPAQTPRPRPVFSAPSNDADDKLEDEDQELAETSSGNKPPPPPVLSPTVIVDRPPAVVDVTYKTPVYTTLRPRPLKPLDTTRRPPATTEGVHAVVTPSRVGTAPEADLLETVSIGRPVSQPLPPPPPPKPSSPAVAPTPVKEPASTKVKKTEPSAVVPQAPVVAPTTPDRTWTTLPVALEGSQTRQPDRRQPVATSTDAILPVTPPTAGGALPTSPTKATSVVVTSGSKTVLLLKPTAARVPTTPRATKTTPPPRRPTTTTGSGGLFDDFDDDETEDEGAEEGAGAEPGAKVDLGVASSNQDRVVVGSSAAPSPTHYVTHTHTHTVTATETQVVSAAGRPPETRTVVITRTHTSTVVGTVTETRTLVRPSSVYATVTTTVSATRTVPVVVSPSTTAPTAAVPDAPTTPAAPAAPSSPPPPPTPPATGAAASGDAAEKTADPGPGAGAGDTFFVVVTDPHSKLPPPSGAPLPPGIIEYEVDKEDEDASRPDADADAANVLVTAGVGGGPSTSASPCHPECSAARNEVCQRAPGGRARCLCRPGFARIFPDRPCKPTYTYTLRLVLSRSADRPLTFSPALGDTGSDTFSETSRAAAAGLDRLVMQSDLRDVFHGVTVEGFLPPDDDGNGSGAGIIVTFRVRLSDNTDEERLKEVFRKSLRATNYSLGGTDVYADKERIQHIEAEDFDECTSRQFHDCSENAHCFNLRGTYTCSCREGFADLSENPQFPGRLCSAELIGCERCHFHGTCHARGDDQVQCECFQWYAGDTCHINLKALLIALVTIGCGLVALLLVCVLVTCARRAAGHGRGRGRRHDGTLDRRAMIHDSASEASADIAPALPASQMPVVVFGKKPRPPPMPTVVAVVPPPAPAGFAPAPPPALADQRDRSLTVMIPRAKYRPSPMAHTQPHQPLPTLVSMSTFGDAEKRAIAHESKLLALLEGATKQDAQHQHHHHHHQHQQQQHQQQSSKRKPSNTASQVTECSTPRKTSSLRKGSTGNAPAPGALVSAGFEVSATVGKPTPDSDTETSAVVHNGSTLRTTDSVQINIEETSEPSIKAGSAVETLTVSEARSCDETTIHPPTKTLHSNYSSKQSSNNLNNDEGHTMAERDIGSTFVMPQSHLYTPDRGSDISNFDSL